MQRSILLIALLAASGSAFADGFNYTYLQVAYGTVDIDNISVDGDGFGFDGSYGITDNLNIVGGYRTTDFDSLADVDSWSVGLGVHTPISDKLDVVATVSHVNVETDLLGVPVAEDDGFGLSVDLRAKVSSEIEINAGVAYVDLSNSGDNTGFGVGVLFNLTDTFSLGLAGSWDDDVSVYSASARMYFD